MIHELETLPPQFEAVNSGARRVEMRKADRDYSLYDVLVLKEWNPATRQYTGRECRRLVTHILRGEGLFGLAVGYVAMSITITD